MLTVGTLVRLTPDAIKEWSPKLKDEDIVGTNYKEWLDNLQNETFKVVQIHDFTNPRYYLISLKPSKSMEWYLSTWYFMDYELIPCPNFKKLSYVC